ncbi:hypothetical protein Hdeb2414_s0005g00172181 [Helianthus debilis subsp. tardiflorus]
MAKCPVVASAWLTLAVGLKSFSHCGFLVNLQALTMVKSRSRLWFAIAMFITIRCRWRID